MRTCAILILAGLLGCGSEAPPPPPVQNPKPNEQPQTSTTPRPAAAPTPTIPTLPPPEPTPLQRAAAKLKSTDPEVRLSGIAALEALGPAAASAVPALMEHFKESDERLPAAATKALAAIGAPAVPAVTPLLHQRRALNRWRAAWVLKRIGPPASEAVPALVDALAEHSKYPDLLVEAEIKAALASIGSTAVPRLVEMVSSGSTEEQVRALGLLAVLAGEAQEALPVVAKALNDPNDRIRQAAVSARQRISALARPMEETRAALRSPDTKVWTPVAQELAQPGPRRNEALPELLELAKKNPGFSPLWDALAQCGPEAFGPLSELAASENSMMANNAGGALSRLNLSPSVVLPRMIEMLKGSSPKARTSALRILEQLGPLAVPAIPEVERRFAEGDAQYKQGSINFLSRTRSPEGAQALARMLKDPTPHVRRQALMALGTLGSAAVSVEQAVGEARIDPDLQTEAEQVLQVIEKAKAAAVKETAPPGAINTFVRLEDPDPRAREAAVAELGHLKSQAPQVIPKLVKASGDKDLEVRTAAAIALATLGAPAVSEVTRLFLRRHRPMGASVLGLMGAEGIEAIPELLKERTGRGPSPSTAAIRNMGAAAVRPLMAALADPDGNVRMRAAQVLGEMGTDTAEAIPALEAATRDPRAYVQYAAETALLQIKVEKGALAEVLAKVAAELADPNPAIRMKALYGVIALESKAEPAIPALLEALKRDPSQIPMMRAAFHGIGRGSFIPLVRALNTPDRNFASTMVETLQRQEAPREAAPLLREFLLSPDLELRANVLLVLAGLGSTFPEFVELVLPFLKSESADVRIGASRFLGKAGSENHVAALAPLTKDVDVKVRVEAAKGLLAMRNRGVSIAPVPEADLFQIMKEAPPPAPVSRPPTAPSQPPNPPSLPAGRSIADLVADLHGEDVQKRGYAVDQLRQLGPKAHEAIPAIVQLIREGKGKNPVDTALGNMGSAAFLPLLRLVKETPPARPGDRPMGRAVELLKKVPMPPEAVPEVEAILKSKESPHETVVAVLEILEWQGPRAAALIPACLPFLSQLTRSAGIRSGSIQFLAASGSPLAAGYLAQLLEDPDDSSWGVIHAALIRLEQNGGSLASAELPLRRALAQTRRQDRRERVEKMLQRIKPGSAPEPARPVVARPSPSGPFEEERLAVAPRGMNVQGYQFSGDLTQVAFATGRETKYVYHGEKKGEVFDEVLAPAFSPDGKTLAYGVRSGKEWFVVIGDRRSGPYDRLFERPQNDPPEIALSADGKTVAYAAMKEGKISIVVGDRKGEAYGRVYRPVLSPDGKTVAYTAEKEFRHFIVVGSKRSEFESYGPAVFGPDGRTIAYAAHAIGGKKFVVVGNKKGEEFDEVGQPVFSPDGKTVAYAAHRRVNPSQPGDIDPWFMLVGGQKGESFHWVGTPAFSPDGKTVAYAARLDRWNGPAILNSGRPFVVWGEKRGEEFDEIGPIKFSPDGKTIAYPVRNGVSSFMVVGTRKGEEFRHARLLDSPTFSFSQDGKKLRYGVLTGDGEFWRKVLWVEP